MIFYFWYCRIEVTVLVKHVHVIFYLRLVPLWSTRIQTLAKGWKQWSTNWLTAACTQWVSKSEYENFHRLGLHMSKNLGGKTSLVYNLNMMFVLKFLMMVMRKHWEGLSVAWRVRNTSLKVRWVRIIGIDTLILIMSYKSKEALCKHFSLLNCRHLTTFLSLTLSTLAHQ